MPAKSSAQRKAAGAALSAKRGDTKKSDLKGASRSMVDSMSEKQLTLRAVSRFGSHETDGGVSWEENVWFVAAAKERR